MKQKKQIWKKKGLGFVLGVGLFVARSPLLHASTVLHTSTVQEIKTEGNVRVDTQTLLSHLKIKKGQTVTQPLLDESLKALFATGLFADIVLEQKGPILYVKVVENKLLNQIVFEGNEKVESALLREQIGLRPREVYTPARVLEAAQKIREIYRLKGRFAAQVEPKIIERDQNRVDLVFEIREGPLTSIRRIFFVGNHRFLDDHLKRVILTKEARWYRFFSSDDTYDPGRVGIDKELLRQYYFENGYADFRVLSAVAELTPDKQDFYLTFTIEEGRRYQFDKIDIRSDLPQIKPKLRELLEDLSFSSGDWFNNKEIEKTMGRLVRRLGDAGFSFVDVKPTLKRDKNTHKIDVVFEIVESSHHVYVNKIVIEGNTGTDDSVIRREFRLVEGDPLNQAKLRRSQERIENLDYFSKVEMGTERTNLPDRENVRVKVEEKSTGELMFAGGYSTYDGPLAEIRLRERNVLGRGQELRGKIGVAKRTKEFLIGFTEPYFLGRRLTAGVDLYHIATKQDTKGTFSGGYRQKMTGSTLSMGYEITEALSEGWSYKIRRENISGIASFSSPYLRKMRGSETISAVGHDLFYDKRDSAVTPTEGYYLAVRSEFAGVGGTVRYLSHVFSTGYYYPLDNDHEWVFNPRARYGTLFRVGKPLRLADRFMLGGGSLRGFAESGVGPRDLNTGDALGGQQFLLGTLEVFFPLGLPKEFNVKGLVYSDWGSLWHCGERGPDIGSNGFRLRGSVGTGVVWRSPFGIIGVSFSKALKRVKGVDKIEVFRINFGTEF